MKISRLFLCPDILGHSSNAITLDLYTHVTNDKARTEMDKLEVLYQKIG